MLPPGLTAAETDAWLEHLVTGPVAPSFEVMLLDSYSRPLQRLPHAGDGTVTMSADAEVTRAWSGKIPDPRGEVLIASDAPGQRAVYSNRLIRITHQVRVPALARTVNTPMYTGWITKASREQDGIAIESAGKEAKGRKGCPPLTVRPVGGVRLQVAPGVDLSTPPQAATVPEAIEQIMRRRMGETLFRFPSDVTDKLTEPATVGWEEETWPWPVCLDLAASLGMQLYYAPDGYAVLRERSDTPVYEFTDGLQGDPTIAHDPSGVFNHVIVYGKNNIVADATADKEHPMSPENQAANGIRASGFLPLVVTNDKIGTRKRAQRVADQNLNISLREENQVAFGYIPVPIFEPLDVATLTTDDWTGDFNMRTIDLPTGPGPMTVGTRSIITAANTGNVHAGW